MLTTQQVLPENDLGAWLRKFHHDEIEWLVSGFSGGGGGFGSTTYVIKGAGEFRLVNDEITYFDSEGRPVRFSNFDQVADTVYSYWSDNGPYDGAGVTGSGRGATLAREFLAWRR